MRAPVWFGEGLREWFRQAKRAQARRAGQGTRERYSGRGWIGCGRVWATRWLALSTRSCGRPQAIHARSATARVGFRVEPTGGNLPACRHHMRMAREGRRRRGPVAGAASFPIGAHQRGLRYPATVADRKSAALPASSPRGLWVRPPRYLRADGPAGNAHFALVLTHHR